MKYSSSIRQRDTYSAADCPLSREKRQGKTIEQLSTCPSLRFGSLSAMHMAFAKAQAGTGIAWQRRGYPKRVVIVAAFSRQGEKSEALPNQLRCFLESQNRFFLRRAPAVMMHDGILWLPGTICMNTCCAGLGSESGKKKQEQVLTTCGPARWSHFSIYIHVCLEGIRSPLATESRMPVSIKGRSRRASKGRQE